MIAESVLSKQDLGNLRAFCGRWEIVELAVFGSALREDFGPQSDIDFLARFTPGAQWSLIDHVTMERELAMLLNRPVDLVTFRSIEQSRNTLRRDEIISSETVIYTDAEVFRDA